MVSHRLKTIALLAPLTAAVLLLGGCSLRMPHVFGLGSYYEVTDQATGTVYYTDAVNREDRGVVEFRDAVTGAWVSLGAAAVRRISDREFDAKVGN